ncbi:MAG: glutamyl-tRNA reductase [Thermodesulfobacteriota bacterium]|nr:glutamyl-tRNA reductase [Thermodesulfobacteriota bacterium]
MPLGLNKPQIVLLGVNHNTAPVEVRERLSLGGSDIPALRLFAKLPFCEEVVFLSTCNRVEILISTNRLDKVKEAIKGLWLDRGKVDSSTLQGALYEYQGMSAIRHLFRVASSLDSMVVGEPQILGQLKDAYRMASEAKTAGMVLNRLLHKAFSVAKRIRTETRIASHAVSISYAAVELAKKIFGNLAGKNGMLIGAGEMAELAAQHLIAGGADRLVVANRTLSRAVELSRSLGGSSISLEEVGDALVDADIVISSTGAPGIILSKDQVKRIMRPRRHRLLFFIDIAVPRDIDPKVNDIDNVYLYDIDDLKGVIEFNKAEREKEASKADRMVEAEVIKFMAWMESLNVVPVIQHIQEKGEAVRQKEILRSHKVIESLNDEQQKALDVLTKSIVQKILHDPIVYIKKVAQEKNSGMILDAACSLFGIDGLEDTQKLQDKGLSDANQDKTIRKPSPS